MALEPTTQQDLPNPETFSFPEVTEIRARFVPGDRYEGLGLPGVGGMRSVLSLARWSVLCMGILACGDKDPANTGDSADADTDADTKSFAAVRAGSSHSCAIDTEGALACWGYDDSGQVSDAPDSL